MHDGLPARGLVSACQHHAFLHAKAGTEGISSAIRAAGKVIKQCHARLHARVELQGAAVECLSVA
jgi:hypothetical protein